MAARDNNAWRDGWPITAFRLAESYIALAPDPRVRARRLRRWLMNIGALLKMLRINISRFWAIYSRMGAWMRFARHP